MELKFAVTLKNFSNVLNNEFGTTDPLKYIQENNWDEMQLYKYDHFKEVWNDPLWVGEQAKETQSSTFPLKNNQSNESCIINF